MQENWIPWQAVEAFEDKYFIDYIECKGETLKIILNKNNSSLEVTFNNILNLKVNDESFRIGLFERLINHTIAYGKKTFFLVNNSEYAKQFSEINASPCKHFCLVGDDSVIDILTTEEPQVKFKVMNEKQ